MAALADYVVWVFRLEIAALALTAPQLVRTKIGNSKLERANLSERQAQRQSHSKLPPLSSARFLFPRQAFHRAGICWTIRPGAAPSLPEAIGFALRKCSSSQSASGPSSHQHTHERH